MVPGCFYLKGDRMDENRINKLIGYSVIAIVAYYVLQMIVPFLFFGMIGLVIWRVYQDHNKYK
jgi:hypothetical protein